MFYMFSFNNEPSKAFGIVWMLVDLILSKNRNFCVQCWNFYSVLEREKIMKFLHSIGIQIVYVLIMFHNFLRYISMVFKSLTTHCSVLDRFCFGCIVYLF